MPDRSDKEILEAAARGDEAAFAHLYDRYQQRVRLVAWRISHRADWLDDILNEGWCRAFNQRTSFDPERDFMVWIVGIVRNVYREFCRQGKLSIAGKDEADRAGEVESGELSPVRLVQEAEILSELNLCVEQLSDIDGQIVRLRFFENQPLRIVAQQVNVAEATLRAIRIPEVIERLRRCLARKNIDISDFFSAQGGGDSQ
ncbi:MAG: RNA polymerase sigma factor [Phycisphaerales bacterium]|nr:RNA polymerase sigma factor [Phycisphaerales bacterium]MCB9854338.1 RNA polymerase sigma factor [Phycisphaerales bacterium]MCB9863539.1 RNA polymerase sigma factor [Phycisphaerales bacterium]